MTDRECGECLSCLCVGECSLLCSTFLLGFALLRLGSLCEVLVALGALECNGDISPIDSHVTE